MAGYQDDPLTPECYSDLLFADEIPGLETNGSCFGFTSSGTSPFSSSGDHSNSSPRMLCFGDYANSVKVVLENSGAKTGQRFEPACTGSAPAQKTKTVTVLSPTSNKKRDGSACGWDQNPDVNAGAPAETQRSSKLSKLNNRAKCARNTEKLGDRIIALQQLVSPFGKTDTASVLHEVLSYIKFLQDQVQVLCSPYMQRLPEPSSAALQSPVIGENGEIERSLKDDLRSRGLCLVPVELTLHLAGDSNGADLWSSSAAMLDNVSPN